MSIYDRRRKRYPRLAARAQRQARRDTALQRRQANADIGRIRRQAGRSVNRIQRQSGHAQASARQATRQESNFERGLARNVSGKVATPGLVRRQLQAGAAQVERYGQGLAHVAAHAGRFDTREAQRQMRSDVHTVHQGIAGLERTTAQQNLADLIQAHREAQRSALEDRTQNRKDALEQGIQNVADVINHPPSWLDDQFGDKAPKPGSVPQTNQDWAGLRSVLLQENPDMTPRQADLAIQAFRRRHTLDIAGPVAQQTALQAASRIGR